MQDILKHLQDTSKNGTEKRSIVNNTAQVSKESHTNTNVVENVTNKNTILSDYLGKTIRTHSSNGTNDDIEKDNNFDDEFEEDDWEDENIEDWGDNIKFNNNTHKNNFTDNSITSNSKNKIPFKMDFDNFNTKHTAWDDNFLNNDSNDNFDIKNSKNIFGSDLNGNFNTNNKINNIQNNISPDEYFDNFKKEKSKLNVNSGQKTDILNIDKLKSNSTSFKIPNINFDAHTESVAKRSIADNQFVNNEEQPIQQKQNILPIIETKKEKEIKQENKTQVIEGILQKNPNIVENKDNTNVEYIYSPTLDFSSPIPPESFAGDGYQKIRSDRFAMLNTNATEKDLLELYKQNKDLESLDISNCDRITNFDIISKFENLKELNVNNCDNFNNIECLQGCENLRVLNIGNTKVRNIDNIGIFPELRILNCTCNSITNVDNIGKCEKLVELNLWGSVSVNSIDGIDSLYNLRLLDVDSTSIVDLFPTVNCKKLEFLFMDNCTKLMDIYALSSLSSLRCLLADGKNMFTDSQLEVFEDLTTLEYLTLNSRRVQTLHYFRKLIKMKELILQGCNITDLRPVEDMIDMKKIDLTANSMLKDINPLHKMKGLKKLILGGGGTAGGKVGSAKGMASSNMIIEDISVVENFNQLEEINLSSNIKLKDISAMHVCEKMEEVDFSKCMQLEDVSVLGTLKNITKINVSSCPRIKELYFLRNLPELQELLYNGTIVSTPGLTTVLKKANGIYLLKGNDADIVSQAMLTSGKKKAKLTKAFKKYFSNKEDKK